jgi:hypothetical protein
LTADLDEVANTGSVLAQSKGGRHGADLLREEKNRSAVQPSTGAQSKQHNYGALAAGGAASKNVGARSVAKGQVLMEGKSVHGSKVLKPAKK